MFDDYDFEDYGDECYDEGYEEGYSAGRRSGGGSKSGGSSNGCYIATAVYGSYDCPQVWVLRRFRDGCLRRTALGRLLVKGYYAVSPGLVRRFGSREGIQRPVRRLLDAFVRRLKRAGLEDGPYSDR